MSHFLYFFMKKFVAFILICLLAANVCGASISYHFCGKIFQYFAFNGHKKKSKCCCRGTQKKIGCCKTKHCKVTVDDNKSFAKQLSFSKHTLGDALTSSPINVVHQFATLSGTSYAIPLINSPPLVRTVPLHVLHQQFLI